jgi:S-adenosylmethionine:tRNA ribosyltransferase-isomerase
VTLSTSDFDYELPAELIAQWPAERREDARLLVLDRRTRAIAHDVFSSLPSRLHPGDFLVANRSRVIPARLKAVRESGGAVEIMLLQEQSASKWRALARPSRKLRAGSRLCFGESTLQAVVASGFGGGEWLLSFEGVPDVAAELRRIGDVPLPPYIHNGHTPSGRYQTVYADRDGSVAAPTAGFHFSGDLISRLKRHGIGFELVTLHVGPGTFRPVNVERIDEHRMDAEWGEVPAEVAERINQTRSRGGRMIAVGTTTTRLLETAGEAGRVEPFAGYTDRFIVPGHEFRVVQALVTNFHLPRSTLLMLVSAFAGRDLVLEAYQEAIRLKYRFYSFGDAMLIL